MLHPPLPPRSQADLLQRVVGRKCLRKLRSTSVTDIVGIETELLGAGNTTTVSCFYLRSATHGTTTPNNSRCSGADIHQSAVDWKCLRNLRCACSSDVAAAKFELVQREKMQAQPSRVARAGTHPTACYWRASLTTLAICRGSKHLGQGIVDCERLHQQCSACAAKVAAVEVELCRLAKPHRKKGWDFTRLGNALL